MSKLNTSILTILALSGVMFVSAVEAGGMGMGNQNGPQSAYDSASAQIAQCGGGNGDC